MIGDAGAEQRLAAILDDARTNGDAHVEVFALDALGRIAAEAGDLADRAGPSARRQIARMEEASHFITERDRTDAHVVRRLTDSTGPVATSRLWIR